MSSSNCCFLTCIQVSQEADQVIWYSHLFQNFPHFFVIHTVKSFDIVGKAKEDVFLGLSCFFDDPVDVENLISGSSAFYKTDWTSRSSQFTIFLEAWLGDFWALLNWCVRWANCAIVWTFFGIAFLWAWNKNNFSSPVATAEFSKYAGVLRATLSQLHHLGLEIAQLEFHHLH